MRVEDIKLKKTTTDPRLMQILSQMIQIMNEGLYEQKVFTTVPGASDPGFEGEVRKVLTGSTLREYVYVSGNWYSSESYTVVS